MCFFREGSRRNYEEREPRLFTNLQNIAFVQSVKGSNSIEDIVSIDKRIEEIVNQNSNPLNRNEDEIRAWDKKIGKIGSTRNAKYFRK